MHRAEGNTAGQSYRIGIRRAGDAEIRDLGDQIRSNKYILRFNVSMDNASLMSMFQGKTNLNSQRDGQLPVKSSSLLDQILQSIALDIFLDYITQVLILSIAKNFDDVRMIEA